MCINFNVWNSFTPSKSLEGGTSSWTLHPVWIPILFSFYRDKNCRKFHLQHKLIQMFHKKRPSVRLNLTVTVFFMNNITNKTFQVSITYHYRQLYPFIIERFCTIPLPVTSEPFWDVYVFVRNMYIRIRYRYYRNDKLGTFSRDPARTNHGY